MVKRRLTAVLLCLIIAGLAVYLFVFSVPVDMVAAQYRLGKVIRIIRPPLELGDKESRSAEKAVTESGVPVVERAGLFFKFPVPFDSVLRLDQRVRYVDGAVAQLQLPDNNQILPRVYATWRVVDPVAFQKAFSGDERSAEEMLKSYIGKHAQEVFGKYNLSDLVNTDAKKLKLDEIEREILRTLKQSVESSDKDYGIIVCDLGITRIALPEDATGPVFARMETERRNEAGKLVKEGETIKRTTIAEARQKREITVAKAEAEAKNIRAEGEAEAAKSYKVFAANEQLAIFLRRLDAFRDMARNAADANQPITFIFSTDTPPFDALNQRIETGVGLDKLPLPAAAGSGDAASPQSGGGK